MKWLLIIAGVIVLITAIIYIVGLTLPVKHVATVSRSVPATTDEVWDRITDVAKFTSWRKKLKQVEIINNDEWVERFGNDKVPMKVKEKIPGKRLVGVINSKDLPFGGEWVYELQPQGNSTVVSITENGEVYNPIFRFMSKFIMGHSATMKDYLNDLQTSFK